MKYNEAHRLSDPGGFTSTFSSLAHGLFGKTSVGDPVLAGSHRGKKGVSRIVLETNGASDFSVSLQSIPTGWWWKSEGGKARTVRLQQYRTVVFKTLILKTDSQNKAFQNKDFQNKDFQGFRQRPYRHHHSSVGVSPVVPGRAEESDRYAGAKFRLVLDADRLGWVQSDERFDGKKIWCWTSWDGWENGPKSSGSGSHTSPAKTIPASPGAHRDCQPG